MSEICKKKTFHRCIELYVPQVFPPRGNSLSDTLLATKSPVASCCGLSCKIKSAKPAYFAVPKFSALILIYIYTYTCKGS